MIGQITLVNNRNNQRVNLPLDEGPIDFKQATAAWQTFERYAQTPATFWRPGDSVGEMSVKVFWDTDPSVNINAEWQEILDLYKPLDGQGNTVRQPPSLTVLGTPFTDVHKMKWVITSANVTDYQLWANGSFMQLFAEINFLGYYPADDPIVKPALAAAGFAGKTTKSKTYITVAGDTLYKIASKVLGDPQKWKLIRDANSSAIRKKLPTHPGKKVKAGLKIKVPAQPSKATAPRTKRKRQSKKKLWPLKRVKRSGKRKQKGSLSKKHGCQFLLCHKTFCGR